MLLCAFSTSSAIKGNSLINSISFSNFIHNVYVTINQKNFINSLINSFKISSASALFGTLISLFATYGYIAFKKNKRVYSG